MSTKRIYRLYFLLLQQNNIEHVHLYRLKTVRPYWNRLSGELASLSANQQSISDQTEYESCFSEIVLKPLVRGEIERGGAFVKRGKWWLDGLSKCQK